MKRLVQKQYSKEFLQKVYDFVKNKNKFRFKTAELNVEYVEEVKDGLRDLTLNNRPDSILSIYNEIVQDCPNATFSGTAYRKFSFSPEIFSSLNTFTNGNDEDCYIMKDLVKAAKNEIQTGKIQSCSKNLQACEEFASEFDGIEVIIEFKCTDALDIMNVCNFYMQVCKENDFKDLESSFLDTYNQFKNEEEVLAVVPEDYEICEIENIPASRLYYHFPVDEL